MKRLVRRLGAALLLCWAAGTALAAQPGAHAVATAHPLATSAALEVLAEGGNAFDAAVAASAAIGVVEPSGSGLGGGGFWLLHRAADDFQSFVDGRETAPLKAHERLYLDASGRAVDRLSRDGALAAAIPGQPAALVQLSSHYGRLPLARALAPAIRYAREGFACDDKLAQAFAEQWPRLSPAARAVFAIDGRAPRSGERLRQRDLADTLERIAAQGRDGFYRGVTAQRLVEGVSAAGGIWSHDDLLRYEVVERRPLTLFYRSFRVVTAPPPSAGGTTLGQVLNQLEILGAGASNKHLVVESLRRAYRDRAAYLGDPDFVPIPLFQLLSRSYARVLAGSIVPDRATPSAQLPPAPASVEGRHTTHLSILDAEGNRVAATLSINLSFGSGFMAPGTGVLLNDEMDDFAASLNASNAYGLVGSRANLIAPRKRPLSSMTPTFVEGPRGLLVIGTPGGSRIITMVLLGLLGWTEGASLQQTVALPRYHHQYLPDVIQFEPGALAPAEQQALQAMGHKLAPLSTTYGNMQAVSWDPKTGAVEAAADPRGLGAGRVLAR